MINQNFVIVGFIIQCIGGMSYFVDTLKGKIQPNRVSWFIWSLAPLTAFAAEVAQGVGIRSLATFGVGFFPLLIFIASFFNKKAMWKLGRWDFVCGAISILGLLLWWMTKIGNIAIVFSILSDAFASLPTIAKSVTHPESESYSIYLTSLLSNALMLFTITSWDFATYGFSVYMVIICALLLAPIIFPRRDHIKVL
jgi:hypothetical protein